jgi:putative DNA primase/helicase
MANFGVAATCNAGGAGKWRSEHARYLHGADVVVIPDNDPAGREHGELVAKSLVGTAARTRVLELPGLPEKGDASDWFDCGGTAEQLWRLAERAPDWRECPDEVQVKSHAGTETIQWLAKLPPLEYDRQRRTAAERLGCRINSLDTLVKAARDDDAGEQGRRLVLTNPIPWQHAVDGAELLDALASAIRGHVVMSDQEAEATALWVVHCHAFDLFTITPRLAATSPEKRCGKTTLLDILACLVPRPLLAANLSTAATYRTIEVAKPTLLIDEADTFLGQNEELRGVLNSGHRAGSSVVRLVGERHEPRCFATHAPVAIALIGTLPGTLADRSIRLRLRRRRPDEQITPFRVGRTDDLKRLASMAARWVHDNRDRLKEADPNCGRLFNRDADNWRPLLAIAEVAGGRWPAGARNIAECMVSEGSDDQQSIGTMLLTDIDMIFRERGADRLASEDIVGQLLTLEGRPWSEFGRARKPISKNALARLLKQFNIVPHTIRVGTATPKGYLLIDFKDAFARYVLPEQILQPPQCHTPSESSEPAGNDPQQVENYVVV